MIQRIAGMSSIMARGTALFSSISSLISASCGGACGVACLSGGCCGSTALLSFIGLSGATGLFFQKLTPVFLLITILSLSYAFYKAYKPKNIGCCNKDNDNNKNTCYTNEKKIYFFHSKTFLWATTILCAIMWLYPYAGKFNHHNAGDLNASSKGSCSAQYDTANPVFVKTFRSCCP